MKCEDCEYEKECFALLKKANKYGFHKCLQGRKKAERKSKYIAGVDIAINKE